MTLLKKPVRRETEIPADHHGRPIVLELDPAGLIIFREKGLRRRIPARISWLYQKAMEAEADRIIRARQKGKCGRKK